MLKTFIQSCGEASYSAKQSILMCGIGAQRLLFVINYVSYLATTNMNISFNMLHTQRSLECQTPSESENWWGLQPTFFVRSQYNYHFHVSRVICHITRHVKVIYNWAQHLECHQGEIFQDISSTATFNLRSLYLFVSEKNGHQSR